MWNDRNGTHNRQHRVGDYDALAVYCPDRDECYYLRASELSPSVTTLRITDPVINQVTRLARWFVDPARLFTPKKQHPKVQKSDVSAPERNRTPTLRLRRSLPYPFGHRGHLTRVEVISGPSVVD